MRGLGRRAGETQTFDDSEDSEDSEDYYIVVNLEELICKSSR